MIKATARVLRNVVNLEVGPHRWVATPRGSGTTVVGRALSALFSTDYEVAVESAPEKVVAHVTYNPKKDEIVIQKDDERWQTRSDDWHPIRLIYGGVNCTLHEKITGRFALLRGEEEVVAVGQKGYRSITIPEHASDMQEFLGYLALGLLIRTLFWELAF